MRSSKSKKKLTCFEWMPDSPTDPRSYFNPIRGLFTLVFLMQILGGSAKTLFRTWSPSQNEIIQNILECCNGQEAPLLELLKANCGIFGIEGVWLLDTAGAVSTSYGRTFEGDPACRLLYRSDTFEGVEINPCLNGTLARNVLSGTSDDCGFKWRDFRFSLLGAGVLFWFLLVILCIYLMRRSSRQGNQAIAPVNDNAQGNELAIQMLPITPHGRFTQLLERFQALKVPENASEELREKFARAFTELKKSFEAFQEKYICGINMEIINDPVVLDCTHSFELSTLVRWTQQNLQDQGHSACPTCRSLIDYPIRLNNIRKDDISVYLDRLKAGIENLEKNLAQSLAVAQTQEIADERASLLMPEDGEENSNNLSLR